MRRRGFRQRVRTTPGMAPWVRFPLSVLVGLAVLLVPTLSGVANAAEPTWVAPVNAPMWDGFKPPGREYHHGVDLGAQRFVPIRAASSGTVVAKVCNASLYGEPYSCDIDGSPEVQGCGWYIDIAHSGGIVTRYCHMVAEPMVGVGDSVVTGQRIGYVGSSGNSSAAHLHFEVHMAARGERASNANAVDPIPFMIKRGAPLGIGNDKPEPPGQGESEPVPLPPPPPDGRSDLNGDGLSDLVVWRPAEGRWYVRYTDGTEPEPVALGVAGDLPVMADYDGDGKDDPAVWRASDGRWLVQTSSGAPVTDVVLGTGADFPVPGDYDGDGRSDFAVWQPYNGQWLIKHATGTDAEPVGFGQPGDLPVVADYDGDSRDDIAVWRPSDGQWFVRPSADDAPDLAITLGAAGDIPVPGDYDGDGLTDFAVWRPVDGDWFVVYATGQQGQAATFGAVGDFPVVGDYDGDGKDDLALWRPSDGRWFILASAGAPVTFGQSVVVGVPAPDVVLGVAGDLPANRPQWLDAEGQPPSAAEVLLRKRIQDGTSPRPAGPAPSATAPPSEFVRR